jgi:hypothetical protein
MNWFQVLHSISTCGATKSHPFAELDWQRWYRILTKPGALIGELGALVGRVVQVESLLKPR